MSRKNTLQLIIDRAVELARQSAANRNVPFTTDEDGQGELIFPHAVRFVLDKLAQSGESLEELMQTHDVAMSAGRGELPKDVIRDMLKSAFFPDRPFVSFLPNADYQRFRFNQALSYFSISGNTLFFSANGEPYSGTLKITVPSMPKFKESTGEIFMSDKAVDETVLIMAAVMSGEMPLASLMDNTN